MELLCIVEICELGVIMKTATIFMLLASFNSYYQDIEHQPHLKNAFKENIEYAIIKISKSRIYKLISEETNKGLQVEIFKKNKKNTWLLPSVYHDIKYLLYSFNKAISNSKLLKLRKKSRSTFMLCGFPLKEKLKNYFKHGKMIFYGDFKNEYE